MIYYFKSKAARILWLKGNFKFIIIPVVNQHPQTICTHLLVQLRIAKVKTTFCLCENSTSCRGRFQSSYRRVFPPALRRNPCSVPGHRRHLLQHHRRKTEGRRSSPPCHPHRHGYPAQLDRHQQG